MYERKSNLLITLDFLDEIVSMVFVLHSLQLYVLADFLSTN